MIVRAAGARPDILLFSFIAVGVFPQKPCHLLSSMKHVCASRHRRLVFRGYWYSSTAANAGLVITTGQSALPPSSTLKGVVSVTLLNTDK